MEILETGIWWLLLPIGIIFIFAYKKLTKNPDALTSRYEAKKKIDGNPADNLNLIQEALKNAGFKKVGLDKDESRFYAQTKFSMSSFSEYIEVSYSHNNYTTDLKFKSICALPTQVVGWGKNKRNFKKFERELEKPIPSEARANAA